MANKVIKSINLLPEFLRTEKNAKFLSSTVDQLIQTPQLERIDGYVGSKLTPTYSSTSNVYIPETSTLRRDYQLDPALVINDSLGNVQDVIAIDDLINEISTKGGKNNNLDRLLRSEYYSFDPHIDWDKLVNYAEYYWLATGPESILITGQQKNSTSTYSVRDSDQSTSFIFNPNGLIEDPLITLYKGNTYNFNVSSVHNFYIKSAPSAADGDLYNYGVTNNGTSTGVITIVVNQNTPEKLYYISGDQILCQGEFVIKDITQDTAIDVEAELLGKKNYISGTGIALTNGMKISFGGDVTPASYKNKEFFVEGVGSAIKLIDYELLVTPGIIANIYDDSFDVTGFDTFPFDSFKSLPLTPDYLTINRASRDLNPWTRYNRWVHKDVISATALANKNTPVYDSSLRAKRPIIEFKADLKLYNFGSVAVKSVNLIDNDTLDAFSSVEGTPGYHVDGVLLEQGHRVIFNADLDSAVRGRIYEVNYNIYNNKLSLELIAVDDSIPPTNGSVVVSLGNTNAGTNWWYNGDTWVYAQQHDTLNQAPLFELFDDQGRSYSDATYYQTSFRGNKIFSYEIGTGTNDPVLGFPLTYKNSVGVGSYLFKNYFMADTISIAEGQNSTTISTGITYCKFAELIGDRYANIWSLAEEYQIPILQFQELTELTSSIELTAIDNAASTQLSVDVFVNENKTSAYAITKTNGKYLINFNTPLAAYSRVLFKIYTDATPNANGYYETPLSLTNNPLNGPITSLTLSDLSDHLHTMVNRAPAFVGTFPGNSNIRDLSGIEKYGSRLISNATPITFAQTFIGKKEHSVIDAIGNASEQYNQFKLLLLRQISLLSDQTDPVNALDTALKEINKDRDILSPYYLSDMIAYGTDKNIRTWTVTNSHNTLYPLSNAFDHTVLSTRSVLVYLNGVQLILGKDYTFDIVDSYINVLIDLVVGDVLVVTDYPRTAGCFVPPTPTKLGLYPKYEPSMFVDNTYLNPTNVIQGHDGSIMAAYNDFRDDIVLEFEKRVYNNIKTEYRTELFNIDAVLAGAFRSTEYSQAEINDMLQLDFVRWTGLYSIDYTSNNSFDETNPFTWNYSGAYNIELTDHVSGYWRGVYTHFYDTDRPHTHPWEMLGFSVQPDWWTSVYGPAPYTSGNDILWNDIERGYIAQGSRAGIDLVYARPGLSKLLPVDSHGELVDPSTILTNITPFNRRQGWKFGDHSPAETAWRRSSHYPFAVQRLLALIKPVSYASLMYDTSRMSKNIAGQWSYGADHKFLNLNNLIVSEDNNALTAGHSVYISEVGKQRSSTYIQDLIQDLTYANLNLFYKVGGFVSKDKLQILIDSVDPTSIGPGVLLPQEDYNLILNVSNPVKSAAISGIIIQRTNGRFTVKGYDRARPYFNIYSPIRNSNTPSLTVGGVSESYVDWNNTATGGNTGLSAADTTTASAAPTGHFYQAGQIVKYGNTFYRVKVSHRAESSFNVSYYQALSVLPTVGGATVISANKFDNIVTEVAYGSEFNTLQQIYDLIVGYGAWLVDQGFIFDEYNTDFNTTIDWNFTAKEFLYWSTQNWANNSVITLSPFADRIKYSFPNSVVDNVFDSFYEYSILQANGRSMPQVNINVTRDDGVCTISTINSTDGIYFAILNSVQKEHAMVFNNSTRFNDTIYSIETGYRQQRMKLTGFRTANWNGDYFSPGFVYDTATIKTWTSYIEYQPGDVVRYQNGKYYSAIKKVIGSKTFDATKWTLLGEKPVAGLLPNFDYKINQFEDFYSLDVDNFDSGQEKMAQHLTGYTPRVYLTNIFSNPISQYKFYQGFIKEKGTKNAITKLAKASIQNLQGELTYTEEWAFRVGQYGSFQTYQELEVPLVEGKFIENPQVVSFVESIPNTPNDLIYYSTASDRVIAPLDYIPATSFTVEPSTYEENSFKLMTAGYARIDDVTATAYNEASILDIANNRNLNQGDTVWLGFKADGSWDVLRYSTTGVRIVDAFISNPSNEITLVTNLHHSLQPGDIISVVEYSEQVNGIYAVQSIIDLNSITVASTLTSVSDSITVGPGLMFKFVSSRANKFDEIPDDKHIVRLPAGTKVWVDDNGVGKWAVYETVNNYAPVARISPDIHLNQQLGFSISKRPGTDVFAIGAPFFERQGHIGGVYVYQKNGHEIANQFSYTLNKNKVYTSIESSTELGYCVVYDDTPFYSNKYGLLFAGAPAASNINSVGGQGGLRFATATTSTTGGIQEGAVKISGIDPQLVEDLDEYVLLSPYPSNYERFGSSLYVQRNATSKLVLVGATQTQTSGTDSIFHGSGHVYAYTATKTPTTTTVTNTVSMSFVSVVSTSSITMSNTGCQWGYSISGSDDASMIAISAPGYPNSLINTGIVHIFTGSNVTYSQSITSPFEAGARFGEKVLVSHDGSYLFISAPNARGADQSYGKVAVYKLVNGVYVASTDYPIIANPIPDVGMNFGMDMDISVDNATLVISALGIDKSLHTTFNYDQLQNPTITGEETSFDSKVTEFYGSITYSGSAYVYNRKFNRFVLSQELPPVVATDGTNYGHCVAVDTNVVYVGAPAYDNATTPSAFYQYYKIDETVNGWKNLREEEDLVMLDNVQRMITIDSLKEEIVEYLDIIDPLKGRIAGIADQELKFKSSFDPAVYTTGTSTTVNDVETNWLGEHLGELWWDLSTVKYTWYEQGDDTFRKNNWGSIFPGASIDVYEWVGSDLLPSEWAAIADTSEGLTKGISGYPKFADNTVISVKQVYNLVSNSFSNYYYYWVKNKVIIPNVKNRRISSFQVASLIADPTAYGLTYGAVISSNSVILANIGSKLVDSRIHLNVASDTINNDIPKHTEWLLLQEGSSASVPNAMLEKKLLDSLIGHDSLGNPVPNESLSARTRYGIGIRPQQTLFKDRLEALRNLIEFSNGILAANPITGNYSFANLNAQEEIPNEYSHEYDIIVEDNEGLSSINVYELKNAKLSCTVSNGKLRGVSIDDPGYGYRISPTVTIRSDVSPDALITTEIDEFGRVISATIENSGKGFPDVANNAGPELFVRPFTVIVLADDRYNGKWTKYTYDVNDSRWIRSNTQKYNTTLYWKYIDWVDSTYNQFLDYSYTVEDVSEVVQLPVVNGQYIKVKNGGLGTYIILEKTSSGGTFSEEFNIVYRENGTIQILDNIWNVTNSGFGFDQTNAYDQTLFDQIPDLELQYILTALKKDIFVRELKVNWNLFFFKAVKYALSEQKLLDWAFKTSFINVKNIAGSLDQRPTYSLTSSTYYEQYLEEVKPYHTQIRNFTTNYTVLEPTNSYNTDFDLPSVYDKASGKYVTVDTSDLTSAQLNTYPWKSWTDNFLFTIESISVSYGGKGYTVPPVVEIIAASGDKGTGATAQAFIRSGSVISIQIINAGTNYKISPTVKLVGGGDVNLTPAIAYAQLTNNKVRSNLIGLRFDRISQSNQIGSKTFTDEFITNGSSNEFELTWLAQPDRLKLSVTLNGSMMLSTDYTVVYYTRPVNGYNKKFSKIVFVNSIPVSSQRVVVTYEKHVDLQTAVERIENYYEPTAGMPGTELAELMSGIEYPKTTVIGLPLNYTTKWDIEYSPYGVTTWADDVSYYTEAKVVTTATTGSDILILDSITGIAVGQYANIISDLTNVFNTTTVTVKSINTVTNAVRFSSTITNKVDANTSTYQVEFWSYETNATSLDSAIDGGTWSTATNIRALGINPEDIIIDGDSFYSPDTSYAPEEMVPGQVTESLGINVYTKNFEGAPIIFSGTFDVTEINTSTVTTLGAIPPNVDSIVVVFDNTILDYTTSTNFTASTQFTIDWATNQITVAPQTKIGKVGYTIVSIGGGISGSPGVIDVAYDVVHRLASDGISESQLESLASYNDVKSAYVTVNGRSISQITTTTDYGYMLAPVSTTSNRASVIVYNVPAGTSAIQAWFFGTVQSYYNEVTEQVFSITSNDQHNLTLSHPPGNIEPADAQAIVEIVQNGTRRRLTPPFVTYYAVTDINNPTFVINPARIYNPGTYTINSNNFRVYLNGVRLRPGFDYSPNLDNSVSLSLEIVKLNDAVAIVDLALGGFDYDIVGNTLRLINPIPGTKITVITYTDHDGMLMRTERFDGNPNRRFKISRAVYNDRYVWVEINGIPLTSKLDYEVLDDQVTIQISDAFVIKTTDTVVITSVGDRKLSSTVLGYRMFTDIFNRTHFKRLSAENTTHLSRTLLITDTKIYVDDASVIIPPLPSKKMPGVVIIAGERIEFFKRTGNVLSQLRRGTLGTSPKAYLPVGTNVIDQSIEQTVPFVENILVQNHLTTSGLNTYTISTATSNITGYGITLSTSTAALPEELLAENNISSIISAADQVAVYYGGRLLRKGGSYHHDTSKSYDSPEATVIGTTSTAALLPTTSTIGNAYIALDTNHVWVYTASAESSAISGYVYKGLNYVPPEFTINTSTQLVTLNIEGGVGDNIKLSFVKKEFSKNKVWNDEITDNSTMSLMDSSTDPAIFLQKRPAELPDHRYYGR